MAWQMMDVSALADLGVPWRESSFLFNPRLEVPRGKGTCGGLKCIPLCALTSLWPSQLPAELRISHTLISADRMRVRNL
jgi:hypothetical protein